MITMITLQLPKRKHSELCLTLIGSCWFWMHSARLMAFISGKRFLPAAGDFCTAVQKTPDHILPLESLKKLDLTPKDQSDFTSSRNGSVSGDMKTSCSLLMGVGVGDSEKGSTLKTFSPLEALQVQPTVINNNNHNSCHLLHFHCVPDGKLSAAVFSDLTTSTWGQYGYPCELHGEVKKPTQGDSPVGGRIELRTQT